MLINTKNLDDVDGIGEKTKEIIDQHYEKLPWWKRILGWGD